MRRKPELVVLALDGAVPSYVREMAGKGKLPAFQRLMERGVFFTDCRPPFPTITPTCWSSFATGSTPATHGATCQDIHVNGKYPPEYISAYHSGNIQAQTFWEAAAKAGKKSLVIQLPTSGPARSANVLQVAGAGCAAVNMALPDRPTAFVSASRASLLKRRKPEKKNRRLNKPGPNRRQQHRHRWLPSR
ncbi:MAG: alkaline phosphatase family protein [Clostridia bacterium]